jgi:glycosyltransferase involved in cell wall biosynthesis
LLVEKLVIIPTYNEKENIEAMLQAVYDLKQDFHVLVIDDGSPDGTADVVRGCSPGSPIRFSWKNAAASWAWARLIFMALNGA